MYEDAKKRKALCLGQEDKIEGQNLTKKYLWLKVWILSLVLGQGNY